MPPPYPGKMPPSFLPAVASAPTKKIARPASAPNLAPLQYSKPPESSARRRSWLARHRSRPPSHQPSTPVKQSAAALPRQAAAACGNNKKPESGFMAPRDAKTVHPARRLAPGTAVCVRTRFTMITEKCCLVIWLPARVVSSSDAYHCTVKYSADLSPAYAGKVVRKPVDHVRAAAVNKAQPRNVAPAPAPERKDRFL